MEKIPTIFERDWNGNRGVIDRWVIDPKLLLDATATEKVDGTNIRLTIRNHTLVRLEKRRNPDKIQKAKGIVEPWYVDADEFDKQDKWIWDAARNTDVSNIEDGEYSGEAFGTNIQGNPLGWDKNTVFLFSSPYWLNLHRLPTPPIDYKELYEYLKNASSTFNKEKGIEGIVWWKDGEPIGKIKLKDFK